MRLLLALFLPILLLAGCTTTQLKSADEITTVTILQEGLSLPSGLEVDYFASHEELSRVIPVSNGYMSYNRNAGIHFKDALELILPDMFQSGQRINTDSKAQYIFKFESKPKYRNQYTVDLVLKVIDPTSGAEIFTTSAKGTQYVGMIYDEHGLTNAYAKAIKEASVAFLNFLGVEKHNQLVTSTGYTPKQLNLRELFKDLKPASTGTGFYVNDSGTLVTASHVVKNCIYINTQNKGVEVAANITANSKLLDLAVLNAEVDKSAYVLLPDRDISSALGQQIFTVGYPLSQILSPYPSLTMGNVSSLGGLKGAKGMIQFSAPIQPGNSGGPVVDFQGNLVAVVASTLNQRMMLRATGTTSQNINFGMGFPLVKKFLINNNIYYPQSTEFAESFEEANKQATEYTVQVLCYK